MPLYEYKCTLCSDVFEVMQKFSDEPLREHAGCGGKLERIISAPALQFKGSGWYVTDYGRNGSKSEGPDGKKSEGKDAKKSDTTTPAASGAKETSTAPKSDSTGKSD